MTLQLSRRLVLGGAAAGAALPLWPAYAQVRNVIDTLAGDTRFGRFVELVSRAGLVEQLRGAGPFTVFAPTDTAFGSAPQAMLQDLLSQGGSQATSSPDPIRLRALVQYHYVEGAALASGQLGGGERRVRTANGSDVLLRVNSGAVTVVNPAPAQQVAGFGASGLNVMPPAQVVQPDIVASNGVIHAINGVLFP